jgi:hypothetical protein
MNRNLGHAAILAILCTAVPAGAELYQSPAADQILALVRAGRGACFGVRSSVNPTTNVVEQAFCRCVANVNGVSGSPGNQVVDVTLGAEQPCSSGPPAMSGPTPQQRQDASVQITKIDAETQQWHNFLQNPARDNVRYQNEPGYRAEWDNWFRYWSDYGRTRMQQLRAERDAAHSVANAPAAGTTIGPLTTRPVPGAGAGAGPGLLGVPMTPTR